MEAKFDVTGMTCSACAARIEREVKKIEGVNKLNVNFLTNSLSVDFDIEKLTDAEIMNTVQRAGYGASRYKSVANPVRSQEPLAGSDTYKDMNKIVGKEIEDMKKRLVISICFLIPLIYISMHHMIAQAVGIPAPSFMIKHFHGTENSIAFAFSQFILLLPILFFNQKYFANGFKALLGRSPNMDSLIAIGSGAATIYGIFAIFKIGYGLGYGNLEVVEKYSMDLYFESAGTILTLITIGKYLETKSKGKTCEAITKLINLVPKMALVERDGVETELLVEEVQKEDIVVVKPGGIIPVDGIIIDGQSSVNEAAITGESLPIEKKVGDKVISATINKNGYFKFKATKVGDDTTLAQIIKLVEDASASKAEIAKLADKISGVFVPIVMVIAFMSTLIWLVIGETFEFSMSIGIAVLVISCPCALGLATPVAIMVGTGKGAENGILIKSGEALEIAHRVDTVVLDKTGTITEGKPRVTDVQSMQGDSIEKLLQIAASIEKLSEHPLAEAILLEAKAKKLSLYEVKDFKAILGRGTISTINGRKYFLGNEALLRENSIDITAALPNLQKYAEEAKTPLFLAEQEQLLGIIAVADTIKPQSRQAIDEFRKLGINVIMLTGDNKHTANAIKNQLGINQAIAEVMPEDKEKKISDLKAEGHIVAMIGDGINDAPALVSADVGIAIGAGTDVAIESADIVLMKSTLLDAVTAIKLSKAVIRNIKQNLFWAFFYNSVGIPLAAGVFYFSLGLKLNPMFGAAAMSLSSVCVVSNALRLKLFKIEYNNIENNNEVIQTIQHTEVDKMVKINIEGMSCKHCSGAVEKALNVLEGISVDHVSLEDKAAYIEGSVDEALIIKAIEEEGFTVTSIEQ